MASVTKITKTVTLQVGEQFTLPKGATVTSVTGVLSNSCDFDLPTPEVYKCGYFYFNIDDDNNDNHPNDESNTKVTSIKIYDNTVLIDQLANSANITNLNEDITTPGLFVFLSVDRYTINDSGDDKRKAVFLHFKAVESVFDSTYLILTANATQTLPAIYRIYPIEDSSSCSES
jgi:hypothetical protein